MYGKYTSVDVACRRLLALGRGSMMAKFDVQGAFRTVPVHMTGHALGGQDLR